MFTTIGGIDAGDLHSSIVALDFDTTPRDFVTLAACTPHRYTLSIEENIIPIEFAEEVRAEFIGEVPLRDGDPFAARFFDYAYMHVLRGPHEGHLLEVPPLRGDLEDRESALIDLVARIPMVRAMARPALLDSGLLSFLKRVAGDEPADRDVRNLLRHCSTTLSPKSDLGSPPRPFACGSRASGGCIERRRQGRRRSDSAMPCAWLTPCSVNVSTGFPTTGARASVTSWDRQSLVSLKRESRSLTPAAPPRSPPPRHALPRGSAAPAR